MSKQKPVIANLVAAATPLEAGKEYLWCRCGRSKTQPFCNGAHKGTSFEPLAFTPDETKLYMLCRCKYTEKPPFCDQAHKGLS